MGKQTFYLFGYKSQDQATVYDGAIYGEHTRFHFCDKPADLPVSPGEGDLAIVKNNKKLFFVDDGEWTEIKGK